MTEDVHGVPGPSIGVLRAASAGLMLTYALDPYAKAMAGAVRVERYVLQARALGATEEQARNALCGATAPTDADLNAALDRLKLGLPPMSGALREAIRHLVESSPFSFAAVMAAVEVLGTPTPALPGFMPWTDEQLAERLPGVVEGAGAVGMHLAVWAQHVRAVSA